MPWTSYDLSAQTPAEDRVLKHFGFPLVHFVIFFFSEKSRPASVKGVGSGHPELALGPLACDIYCPKGPIFRKDPTSALPVLKFLIFLEQVNPHFCFVSHTFIFHWLFKLGSWCWARSEMLIRKEIYPPSLSFLIKFIRKS